MEMEKGTPEPKPTPKQTSHVPSAVHSKGAKKRGESEHRLRAAIQKHSLWIACLSVLVTTVAGLLQPRHPDPIPHTGLGRLQKLLYPMEFSNPRYLSERPWRKVWVSKSAPQTSSPDRGRAASGKNEGREERDLVHALIGNDILARSEDGGAKWRVIQFDPDCPLSSFCFPEDGAIGWCVGGGYRVTKGNRVGAGTAPPGHSFGLVLFTNNGGKTWKRLDRTPVTPGGAVDTPATLGECCLNAVWFVDANTGWMAGYYAKDMNPDPKNDPTDPGVRSFLANTTDGGQTWTEVVLNAVLPPSIPEPKASRAQPNVGSPPYPDQSRAWMGLASEPAVAPAWIGAAPPAGKDKMEDPSTKPSAAQMATAAGTDKMGEPSPKQGTAQMTPQASAAKPVETIDFTHACVDCVYFANAQSGYVAGARGTTAFVLATGDGGKTWQEILPMKDYAAKAVYGTAGAKPTVWAIYTREPSSAQAHYDQAVATRSPHPNEHTPRSRILQGSPQSVGTSAEGPAHLRCIASGDGRRVWMTGSLNSTALLLDLNAQRPWTIPGAKTIHSLHFADPNRAFLVGETSKGKGFLGTCRSEAGGAVKFGVVPLKSTLRMPALWCYLALLATVGLLVWAYFDEKKQQEEDRGDEAKEIYVSDDPIESEDEDMFNFAPLARGVSKFLRNESTKPPLTLAIMAPWGGGKSSLLKLIEADLRKYGFQPVWVNAWHHPKEEDFLAALLEHIRLKAVPSMWNPRGWAFRVALVAIRMRRQWPLAFFLLAFLLTTYLVARTEGVPLDFFDWQHMHLPTALLGGGLVASLTVLWRASSAFGITRDLLLGTLGSLVRIRSPVKGTGFRYAFAIQFDDFARALQWSRQARPVIIIDDLDRCQPNHVLSVLESVNFLSSCGQGFVMLGLDMERVRLCITEGYKASVKDPNAVGQDFAEGYLQKIINVRVRVPDIKPDEFERLVRSQPQERHWFRPLLRAVPGCIPNLTAAVLIGALGSYGLLALRLQEPSRQTMIDLRPAQVNFDITLEGRSVLSAGTSPDVPGKRSGEVAPRPPQPPDVPQNAALRWVVSLLLWTGLFLFGAFLLVNHFFGRQLAKRKQALVEDSPRFRQAVGAWLPMLRRLNRSTETPRSLKRFINEIRFIVMRNKADESGQDMVGPTKCPSDWLVALHAAAWFYEPLLSDEPFWTTTVPRFCRDPRAALTNVEERIMDLQHTLAKHRTMLNHTSETGDLQEHQEAIEKQKALANQLTSLERQITLLSKIIEQSPSSSCRWFPDVEASQLGVYRSRYLELREMAEFAGGPSETPTDTLPS